MEFKLGALSLKFDDPRTGYKKINSSQVATGNVRVEARSPSGRVMDMGVVDNAGAYTANFTPSEVGDWMISILYEGQHIQGSPFNVRVYDAAQVKVFGLEGGSVGKTFSFSADCSAAGDGDLTVDINHNGRTVPAQIHEDAMRRGVYRVSFTPEGSGIYTIRVYFAGMEVTGSPYTLEIVDSSMVTATGEGLTNVEANRRATFIVNTHGATGGDIRVNVTSPRGQQVPSQIYNQGDGTFRVEYQSADVGEHLVDVQYFGREIKGSPFRVQVIDGSRISIHNLRNNAMVGRQVEFDIDAAQAGSGNLEIMVNDGTIPCSVQNRGNRQFHATFMPKDPIPHYIQMKFNGKEVPGSPWKVDVRGAVQATASGNGLQLVTVRQQAAIDVRVSGGYPETRVIANITSPTQRTVPTQVNDNHNGTFTVYYTPAEVGNYQIDLQADGNPVTGSPFTSKAYDPSAIVVSNVPNGIVGKSVEFTIDVTQAGEGQLEIMVNRGAVPNTVRMLRKGVFLVSFVPRDARAHLIEVKFNGEALPRCPISVPILDASRVTVQGEGIRQVAVNKFSSFHVNTQSAGDADLTVRVTSPTGRNVPVTVKKTPDGGHDVDYQINEVGTHRFDIEYAGQPVPGSPFMCKSFDSGKVKVMGITNGVVGKQAQFIVDVNNAGEGNMEISLTGNGRNIQNHVRQMGPGNFEVSYTPLEGAPHEALITFNGEHVPGSPFNFNIMDPSKVSAMGDGLQLVAAGNPTSFTIFAPGADARDLNVTITAPSGKLVQPRITDLGNGNFQIDYVPTEIGDHQVDIRYMDLPIPGSPYTARTWDPSAVIVSNIGPGRINKPYFFNIDASRAGAGNLEIICSVAGENVPNFVKSQGNARFEVSFTPQQPDTHIISVKFNGELAPGSPYMAEMSDPGKVHPLERGMIRVPINRIAFVSIDPRRAGGIASEAVIEVIAPSDKTIRAKVQPGERHRLKAEFIPTEVGPHCINVTIGTIELPGSPFACEVYDISRVNIADLAKGVVGKPYHIDIDASKAGQGDIEVVIKGDNKKLPIKLVDKGGGLYKAYFMPKEPIKHLAFITFSKQSVPGSPISFDVEDATLVLAKGRCLEASPISQRTAFDIDPSNAPFRAEASVKILSPPPERSEVPFDIAGDYINGWKVEWAPPVLGVHTIEVKYGDSHVVGSPFRCRVFDLSKVILIRDDSEEGVDLDGIPGDDIVFYVDASEAGAGNLEIIVRCAKSGQRIPNFLEAEDRSGRFKIFFTPKSTCFRYKVDVTFNDEQVEGSPFFCWLVDGRKATASGDGIKHVPTHRPAFFNVHTAGVGEAELEVDVLSPGGRPVESKFQGNPEQGYRVEYTPIEVGRHRINVQYADIDISESPFFPQAYDAGLVRVGAIPDGIVGQPVTFEVDCSMAGEGTMTVDVRGQTSVAYPDIKPKGNGIFDVMFIPRENCPHNVIVTFNGDKVPGSPFICRLTDTKNIAINWDKIRNVPVNRPATFDLDPGGVPQGAINCQVTDPHGRELATRLSRQGNMLRIEFAPMAVGAHIVNVLFGTQPVGGSPYTCYCYDASRVLVTDVTPEGKVGEEMGFTVDTSEAGQGDIDTEVVCNGALVRTQRTMLDHSRHRYTFHPQTPMNHTLDVTFNYEKVIGCPMILKVLDPYSAITLTKPEMEPVAVDNMGWNIIQTQGSNISVQDLVITVTAPNADLVPAKIVQQPDGDYKVEYSSKYTGRHTVEILYAGQAIMGSPFYVEIYDPNKIRVEGMKNGYVGEAIGFDILRHEAGKAELGLTIMSPAGKNIPYEIAPTPRGEHVTYTPYEAGPHHIYITYGGLEVPGCPMNQNISDNSGSLNAFGDGLYKGEEDKQATFYVDTGGKRGDLLVHVEGPNSIAKCNIEPDQSNRYMVTYTPVEVGTFNIHIKWNGREIPGSPFHPLVVDPGRVLVVGGWQSLLDANNMMLLTVNEQKLIKFDCSSAGPGKLSGEVQGPSGVIPIEIQQQADGSYLLAFTPRTEGEHYLTIRWSDLLLPKSPFMGVAKGGKPSINHEKVVLTGRGLQEARIKEEAEFVIDGTDAGPGDPNVKLTGVKQDIDVIVSHLGGNKYRCIYVPQIAGAYLLNIMWSDRQVRGSPFKVNVTAQSDASKVVCTGEGLKMGIMGKEIKSVIDTRRAGPGELTAHCMGPHKVAYCELYDHRDGTFTLNIKPQEPGRHVLQVKYGGDHVPGSPYMLRVSGAPDASKVKVYGPGVEHGILATYQSRFITETRGAGAGQLTVRIRGPKGAFRVEMSRESQKDRTILCRYDPTEVGDYIIHVKWSGEHVPGSPFHVQIFDTQDELERFLTENPSQRGISTLQSSKSFDM